MIILEIILTIIAIIFILLMLVVGFVSFMEEVNLWGYYIIYEDTIRNLEQDFRRL